MYDLKEPTSRSNPMGTRRWNEREGGRKRDTEGDRGTHSLFLSFSLSLTHSFSLFLCPSFFKEGGTQRETKRSIESTRWEDSKEEGQERQRERDGEREGERHRETEREIERERAKSFHKERECVYIHICIYVYTFHKERVCVCIYICIYVYTHTQMHTRKRIREEKKREGERDRIGER